MTTQDKEMAVLRLVADGWKNEAIASELGVTEKCISSHWLPRLFRRFDASCRVLLVRKAIRSGLIEA